MTRLGLVLLLLTRAGLRDAVHREVGLSRRESARFVDAVIEAIRESLAAGETVKISGFGVFENGGERESTIAGT